VALSRARLGLYVLGRKEVFENCYELQPAFDILLKRPTTLQLVTGEMYPSNRSINVEVPSTDIVGVEHLGQYVFEMTQAKIKQLTKIKEEASPMEPGGKAEQSDQQNFDRDMNEDDDMVQPEELDI
jgi:intron-binding protein aquarius